MRKSMLSILFLLCAAGFVFAQNDENRGDGLKVSLYMSVDAFNMTTKTFERADIRGPGDQNSTSPKFFISNWEFDKDANASIGYSGKNFGGDFAFVPKSGASWTFGAAISGWVQFSFLRIVLGNSIETLYADRQGSDNALAVYTVKGDGSTYYWDDPDNITDSNGVLVRAFLNDFTFDVAAGDFDYTRKLTIRLTGTTDENIYKDRFDISYRYGVRAGYNLGDIGKINLSYKLSQKQVAEKFVIRGGTTDDLVQNNAAARFFDHTYGLYGSFYFNNLSFTAGYVGAATSYLSEYLRGVEMVKTGMPFIMRNGIVFNAFWRGDSFNFRTDNALTFWQDKDYDIFNTKQSNFNINLEPEEITRSYAAVNHFVMRNGFGLSFPITGDLNGGVYLSNSFIIYSASGNTARMPGGTQEERMQSLEYVLWKDDIGLSFDLGFHFNPNASASISLKLSDSIVSRSRDVNRQSVGFFVSRVHYEAPEPVATLDNIFTVRIPMTINLSMR